MSQSESVTLKGEAGVLEGLIDRPAGTPRAVAVVCHPHPLYQGTMTNKVTFILARAFNDLGAVSLRFNFRGVGRSDGRFDNGLGETADAVAAITWLQRQYRGLPAWSGGFSFGGYVALRAQGEHPVDRLVTVAPAVQHIAAAAIAGPKCPWLLIQGETDEVVSPQAVFEWVAKLPRPPRVKVLKGAGHFFHGHLNELRQTVVSHFSSDPESP